MAEVVGLVASVVQLAGAGLKLSQTLYQYADGVASADRRIKDIANEVKLTSFVIQELGTIFERDETANLISKNAVRTANETIKECFAVFTELELKINKGKPGKMGRLMLPFKDNKIELLRSQIDKLKSTLELLMQVLIHAHQVSSEKYNREAEAKHREEIKQLLENKKQATQKYEESLRNFSISDGSTIVDDGDRSLQDKDDIGPPSDLFNTAGAIGSTINPDTLATCVGHVRSLLADIETLQLALAEQVNGDDHSDHHQKAIGSYFLARSHLDSVLLGKSQPNVTDAKIRQSISKRRTKTSMVSDAAAHVEPPRKSRPARLRPERSREEMVQSFELERKRERHSAIYYQPPESLLDDERALALLERWEVRLERERRDETTATTGYRTAMRPNSDDISVGLSSKAEYRSSSYRAASAPKLQKTSTGTDTEPDEASDGGLVTEVPDRIDIIHRAARRRYDRLPVQPSQSARDESPLSSHGYTSEEIESSHYASSELNQEAERRSKKDKNKNERLETGERRRRPRRFRTTAESLSVGRPPFSQVAPFAGSQDPWNLRNDEIAPPIDRAETKAKEEERAERSERRLEEARKRIREVKKRMREEEQQRQEQEKQKRSDTDSSSTLTSGKVPHRQRASSAASRTCTPDRIEDIPESAGPRGRIGAATRHHERSRSRSRVLVRVSSGVWQFQHKPAEDGSDKQEEGVDHESGLKQDEEGAKKERMMKAALGGVMAYQTGHRKLSPSRSPRPRPPRSRSPQNDRSYDSDSSSYVSPSEKIEREQERDGINQLKEEPRRDQVLEGENTGAERERRRGPLCLLPCAVDTSRKGEQRKCHPKLAETFIPLPESPIAVLLMPIPPVKKPLSAFERRLERLRQESTEEYSSPSSQEDTSESEEAEDSWSYIDETGEVGRVDEVDELLKEWTTLLG
ncbi:uncharacterized protein J4E87_003436 [Alternaria ethzedia]|uniref:uncharacterized protein n=1 Tax=Alternaria ethzedia TaxID=181014 RepID=UPI0020C1E5F0|nr:uncharacterized protein J4E87_003436 [Alternaria ethzedia]KAI4629175.1 hypothetical protein J4E87_003436 [Alternaria ethzedia]